MRVLNPASLMLLATLAAHAAVAQAQRLVAIGGALTEIVYALGVGDRLVGIDTTSTSPPGSARPASVGYARNLSIEGVLALAPTQVLLTEDAGPPEALRQLRAAGVALTVLPSGHRFEGLLQRIQHIGALTARPEAAAALQARLSDEWQRARAASTQRPGDTPRVLFILSHASNQLLAAGSKTAADAMLRYAGAENVMAAVKGYKPLTPEALAAARPNVILLTRKGLARLGGAHGVLQRLGPALPPGLGPRQVVAVDEMALLGFGPRLPSALAALDQSLRQALTR